MIELRPLTDEAGGSPGLLCAGWMARATRAAEPTESRKAAAS